MFSIFVPSGHPYFRGSLSVVTASATAAILTRRLAILAALAALLRVISQLN